MPEDKTRELVRRLLLEVPENYQLLRQEALAPDQDYDKTIAVLGELLRYRPDDAGTHGQLASFYWLFGNDEEAERHYRAELAINPNEAGAYGLLASIYETRGEEPETIERMLREAVRLEPLKVYRHTNLARFYRDQGRILEAIGQVKEALSCRDLSEDERRELQKNLQELQET